MKAYLSDNWGVLELKCENDKTLKVSGQWVEYEGIKGRLHSVTDVSGHCGGHGMGTMYGVQGILVDEKLNIHKIPNRWKTYNITLLEIG